MLQLHCKIMLDKLPKNPFNLQNATGFSPAFNKTATDSQAQTDRSHVASLTQLVVEGPGGEKSVHPEFKKLSGRCRCFVLRVIGQDFLDHETPVAMSSVVGVNFWRIVMCPHVQRMLHHRAVRSPQRTPSANAKYRSFTGLGQRSYSCCGSLYSPEVTIVIKRYPQVLDQTKKFSSQRPTFLRVFCGACALGAFDQILSGTETSLFG